jgi:hypothetical protein
MGVAAWVAIVVGSVLIGAAAGRHIRSQWCSLAAAVLGAMAWAWLVIWVAI